jgi:hypothetical protein
LFGSRERASFAITVTEKSGRTMILHFSLQVPNAELASLRLVKIWEMGRKLVSRYEPAVVQRSVQRPPLGQSVSQAASRTLRSIGRILRG